jgi:hypothetical protein
MPNFQTLIRQVLTSSIAESGSKISCRIGTDVTYRAMKRTG